MKTGIIYLGINKENNKVYVGQTTKTLKSRVSKHFYNSKRNNNHFSRALNKYSKDIWVWHEVYSDVPSDMLNIAEVCAIYLYDSYYHGYNSTFGGESTRGAKHSAESKRKRSKKMRGQNNPMKNTSTVEKVRKANIGKKHSDETKRKISDGNSGKTVSIETRKKISCAKLGKTRKGAPCSEETKKKISAANLGRKHTGESRKNMSLAHIGNTSGMKGKKHTDAAKKKMSQARRKQISPMFGKKHSKATKDKLSKKYIIIDCFGNKSIIKNMTEYCIKNNWNRSSVYKAIREYKKYKGNVIRSYN